MIYPQTPHHGYNLKKAQRLEQTWDERWEEVMPCEIRPALEHGTASSSGPDLKTGPESGPDKKIRIWKQNYFGHVSSYTPDYSGYSKNRELDSINNHVTASWMAVSNGDTGLLVAQTTKVAASMAFCPMRTRRQGNKRQGNKLSIRLNPFGAYFGRQYHYPTAYSGLGYFAAVKLSASDHISSYAPSFNGVTQDFEIIIAPYEGDAPPEQLRADAEAYTFPIFVK